MLPRLFMLTNFIKDFKNKKQKKPALESIQAGSLKTILVIL